MQIVVPELEIDIGNEGFEQDRLGLTSLGTRLSELVEKADGPFVVAIDGRWGSGKSTFLKMWTGAHMLADDTEANVLYFDAFQHDFLDDPMTSLVRLITAKEKSLSFPKKAINKIRKATAAIALPATRVALAYTTSGITEFTAAAADAAINKAGNIADSEASAFWKKEEGRVAAIDKFKLGLTELSVKKKLVVIVDELDRCRPDYALTLMETVKHFYSVENVIFVLGVNLDSLENSVLTRYGAKADATNYLKKFIHLTTQLPEGEARNEWKPKSIEYFSDLLKENSISDGTRDAALLLVTALSRKIPISLRDTQRVYSRIALLPSDFERWYWGFKIIVLSALLFQVFDRKCYNRIYTDTLELQDVASFFGLDPEEVLKSSEQSNYSETRRVNELILFSWMRIFDRDLQSTNAEKIRKHTKGHFGGIGTGIDKDTLKKTVASAIDVWTLSDT